VRANANKAKGQKKCGSDGRAKLAAETSATADLEAARRELLSAESKATTDSPLQAPTWVLPAALDVIAFMALWTGLSGHRSGPARKPIQVKRRAATKRKSRVPRTTDAKARAEALFRRKANDNSVVPLHAA
jgi:hypothetical protein